MTPTTKTAPIILRPEEVLAALAGRLTALWRVMKKQPPADTQELAMSDCGEYCRDFPAETQDWCCPFPIGTMLWGRETWMEKAWSSGDFTKAGFHNRPYTDTGVEYCGETLKAVYRADGDHKYFRPWKPSSNMPKRASRPELRNLEVVGIEPRRVQSITEAEAKFVEAVSIDAVPRQAVWNCRQDFAQLWDRHAKRPEHQWAANPWAWYYTIRRKS